MARMDALDSERAAAIMYLSLVGVGQSKLAWGGEHYPPPPFPQLSRRSGRIPALPYPPPSCDQYSRARILRGFHKDMKFA